MSSLPVLDPPRFVLRPLKAEDAEAVFSFYADAQTAWFTGRTPFTRFEQAEEKVALDLEKMRSGSAFVWAVTRREDAASRAIGVACLFNLDRQFQHVELGYVLARPHWGQGVMSECVPAVLRYGFEALEVHRIEANVDASNLASVRLLERNGFVREGVLRERCQNPSGIFEDLLCFGLLDREWRDQPVR